MIESLVRRPRLTDRVCSRSALPGAVLLLAFAGGCGAVSPEDAAAPPETGEAEQALTCVTLARGAAGGAQDATLATDLLDPSKAVTTYGSKNTLAVGTQATAVRRSALQFDLSPIPPGALISSATLTLDKVPGPAGGLVDIHRLTTSWTEPTVSWSAIGAAFDPLVAATLDANVASGAVTADLTALVASWSTGVTPNQGILLDQPGSGRAAFGASEAAAASRPRLTVCYATPTCSDGVQNQGEGGVDCGGPCAPCPSSACSATDPYAAQVVLLAHFDGADGSTVFTDAVGHALLPEGGPALSTAQSITGGSSLYVDGSSDLLFMPSDGALSLGTGDYTLEYWAYSLPGYRIAVGYGNYGAEPVFYSGDPAYGASYWRNPAGTLGSGGGITSTLPQNQWFHVAVQRAGGVVRSWVDGVEVGSFADSASYDTACGLRIGSFTTGSSCAPSYFFGGYIDELRLTRGVARYSSTFIPCASSLPYP